MNTAIDWNDKFGNLNDELGKADSPGGFNFEFKKCYMVHVTDARLTISQRGDVQIELALNVVNGDGEVRGKHKEWVQLPRQLSDLSEDAEKVLKRTRMRRNACREILGALDAKYRVGERQPDGSYLSQDGSVLDRRGVEEATVAANRATLQFTDDLHARAENPGPIDELIGIYFYLSKAPNPNNEKYPYTNFYTFPDPKLELAD